MPNQNDIFTLKFCTIMLLKKRKYNLNQICFHSSLELHFTPCTKFKSIIEVKVAWKLKYYKVEEEDWRYKITMKRKETELKYGIQLYQYGKRFRRFALYLRRLFQGEQGRGNSAYQLR